MAYIDHLSQEIHCKIVYCGPPMSGKRTSLQYLVQSFPTTDVSELWSINTEVVHIVFCDLRLPERDMVHQYRLFFHCYAISGVTLYYHDRHYLVQGADGVVFVADSQRLKLDENKRALSELLQALTAMGQSVTDFPLVIQYNKCDIPQQYRLPVSELEMALNRHDWPAFETSAVARQTDTPTGTGGIAVRFV